jgi:hypothetical protein
VVVPPVEDVLFEVRERKLVGRVELRHGVVGASKVR